MDENPYKSPLSASNPPDGIKLPLWRVWLKRLYIVALRCTGATLGALLIVWGSVLAYQAVGNAQLNDWGFVFLLGAGMLLGGLYVVYRALTPH
jgi:hypothetical protein